MILFSRKFVIMKCPLITIVFLLSAIHLAYAQNLIPNPSFENLTFCPTDAGQVPLAEPWLMMLTPDLYAECTENPSYDVPENFTCNVQEPKDGQAYVGLWSYTTYEYIFVDLLEPLKAGKNYFARMYIVPNDDCNPFVAYTQMDAFAMAVRQPGNQNNLFIVAENTNGLITDTDNWTEITGCYQAQGGERTIQVGNIRGTTGTNINVDSTLFPDQPYFVYMFVDDLLLEEYDPFPDTLYLCNEETIELDATFHEAEYRWSTGDTAAILQITEAGSYAAIAEIGGCRLIDRVQVIAVELPDEMPLDV